MSHLSSQIRRLDRLSQNPAPSSRGIAAVWIVRDANRDSSLGDILWKQSVEGLGRYILGCGPGVWEREHHTLYTNAAAARADAEMRSRRFGEQFVDRR